ncbi:MAG: CoA pyrophosphatase [Parvibaculaceae bacterium]|nr:CoA pyrophosphatase [Parvibaculaceae bacterium]
MIEYRQKILDAIDAHMPSPDDILLSRSARGDHDLNPVEKTNADGRAPKDDEWIDDKGETRSLRLAAVLVPIVERKEGPTVLLTRRADHLNSHSGQVAFPGGKVEPGESLLNAALREAEEEVGLDRSFVDVQGYLDVYETGSGFRILPVVSFVKPGFTLQADANEVADIFEVPLAFLMNPENQKRHSVFWRGKDRAYYAMTYDGFYIWGATAGMLKNMSDRLGGEAAFT